MVKKWHLCIPLKDRPFDLTDLLAISGLTLGQRVVFLMIDKRSSNGQTTSRKDIAREIGCSESTASTYLKTLGSLGLILEKEKTLGPKNRGQFTSVDVKNWTKTNTLPLLQKTLEKIKAAIET